MTIKILTVLVDRANYGRLKPVMRELELDSRFCQKVLCAGSMPLRRFGKVADLVRADGFDTLPDVFMEIEGGENISMGMSVGIGIQAFSQTFSIYRPNFLLIIGDRFEALAATIAAVYQNIRIIHVQGGEVSGSIDESNRHAITKMAHLHFPATEKARDIILRMGEDPKFVHNVGCPVGDIILGKNLPSLADVFKKYSFNVNAESRYGVVVYHPNTIHIKDIEYQFDQLIESVGNTLENDMLDNVFWFWPNIDAGSEKIHVKLRSLSFSDSGKVILVKSLLPDYYQSLIKSASILIGNSSSFVRDSSFSGVPVLLLGDRQKNREISDNVTCLENSDSSAILAVLKLILDDRTRKPSFLYGTGDASKQIVDLVATLNPPVQKVFHINVD